MKAKKRLQINVKAFNVTYIPYELSLYVFFFLFLLCTLPKVRVNKWWHFQSTGTLVKVVLHSLFSSLIHNLIGFTKLTLRHILWKCFPNFPVYVCHFWYTSFTIKYILKFIKEKTPCMHLLGLPMASLKKVYICHLCMLMR